MNAPRTTSRHRILTLVGALFVSATAAQDATAAPVTTTAAQRSVAAKVAASKVGSNYSWGATGPRSFDCSGLVGFSYRTAGKPLGARTTQQLAKLGARISRAGLKRGDLVFTYDRKLGHVGVYLGRGRYVHAPGTGRRVTIAPVPSGRSFVRAVRP